MARRTRGRAVPPPAERRAAYRDTAVRSRGTSLAFSRSFVLILSALCCGYCGADTEFSILEEAQVLADQMKKLSSQELGVFTMQVSKGKPFRNGPNLRKYERRDAANLPTVAGFASEGNFADVSSTISSVVWFFEVRTH